MRSEYVACRPRPSILLTGFGAFPGVDTNATAELVPQLAAEARRRFPGHEILEAVLPVEWLLAPQRLQELVRDASPRLALHFGVSSAATGFQIELVGRNLCEARHDAAGKLPVTAQLVASGPAILASTLPAEHIVRRLQRAGLPCCTSNDAGGYLCNALLYHSLTSAHASPEPFLSGFVHLPAGLQTANGAHGEPSACGLSWRDAIAGGIEIIATCLDMQAAA